VWSTIENGDICVASATRTTRQKLENIRRDPRVAISYQSPDSDPVGMAYYLVVHGRARVTEGGADELLARIAPRYVHPGTKFPRVDNPPSGYVTRITPVRWRGYGPWGGAVGLIFDGALHRASSVMGLSPAERFYGLSREDWNETAPAGNAPGCPTSTRVSSREDWSVSTTPSLLLSCL
jgi:hypothetical protein